MSDAQEIYGIRIATPDAAGWEDHTVFRWAAPRGEGDKPFRSNCMLTRHDRVPAEIPFDKIFTGPNTAAKQSNKDFQVLREGVTRYLDQDAAWQDTRFFEPSAQRMIFQRQIAIRPRPDGLVVMTLTSDENNLDDLSAAIEFKVPVERQGKSKAAAAAARAAKRPG